LHHVKLVFWNDPANREHGAEVRNAYTSALSFVHAARKAVNSHRKNASSIPDEILVQRCPEDRVLWTASSVYMSGRSLDRGIGDDFTSVLVPEATS
jgi:hypothetical protein